MSPLRGARRVNDTERLTQITSERAKIAPHPLACRFTKFKQNFKDPLTIPKNLVGGPKVVLGGPKRVNVGQIPKD